VSVVVLSVVEEGALLCPAVGLSAVVARMLLALGDEGWLLSSAILTVSCSMLLFGVILVFLVVV
jgi:hypothetical protein